VTGSGVVPAVTPPGWPAGVLPPDAPGWQASVSAWLLDACPPDYRAVPVLRRHPAVLARFAHWHVAGAREAARRGLATLREDLRPLADAGTIGAATIAEAVQAMEIEAARLAQLAREVAAVEAALRGQRHVPRL
jgi:hypothetical protein